MISPFDARAYRLMQTGVTFRTDDGALAGLFRKAEQACLDNQLTVNGKRYLREGGGYRNIWLETQPMGGAMYAVRDPETALNNILIFMQYQRRDGRMPGMLFLAPGRGLCGAYDWFQGFCFPTHALQMADYMEDPHDYLLRLYDALKDFDDYLWRYRANADGCLERWCCWDTAEDNLSLLLENGGEDGCFGGEIRPEPVGRAMPWTSMEMMGWSCLSRMTLAEISRRLGLGEAERWQQAAGEVRARLRDSLWNEERAACFEKDAQGRTLDCLSHENLRCMYYGVFSQDMAEAFVARHLMNPDEFLTPVPLPSIAANDRWFRNITDNNWSGPSQGLTWQRAVQALMNYGFYAELARLGKIWLRHLCHASKLTQQYDPFTGAPGDGPDDYGPTCLSALEYIALLYGVHVEGDRLAFASLEGRTSCYEQRLGEHCYRLERDSQGMTARLDGRLVFRAPHGLRVVTDRQGRLLEAVSLLAEPLDAALQTAEGCIRLHCTPNRVISLEAMAPAERNA